MPRAAAILGLFALIALPGCEGIVQDVYDERAEEECQELRNVDEQRACLNAIEDRERERRRRERMEDNG